MGNEEALCEALIALLERKARASRSDMSFPERDGSGPPVEIRCRIGEQSIAVEHTMIEPFPDAIRTAKEFGELIGEIETDLSERMPKPGVYTVIFPVHPTAGHHRRTHARLRDRISSWIVEAARELHELCPERRDRHHQPGGFQAARNTEIEGIPLTLSRRVHWRESGRHDGRLFIARSVGDDVETQRLIRMATALEKKLPKLSACKALGDTTHLILEWSDIALSNEVNIALALEQALAARMDIPDHVYLADTSTERWYFFEPVSLGEFSIDMRHFEIDRPDLVSAA